jgi:hypothetical protein
VVGGQEITNIKQRARSQGSKKQQAAAAAAAAAAAEQQQSPISTICNWKLYTNHIPPVGTNSLSEQCLLEQICSQPLLPIRLVRVSEDRKICAPNRRQKELLPEELVVRNQVQKVPDSR